MSTNAIVVLHKNSDELPDLVSNFTPVAIVYVESEYVVNGKITPRTVLGQLNTAYELTNSIDEHWSANKAVFAFDLKARSTSVGDIAIINQLVFKCMPIGWEMVCMEVQ